jgi:hypothetical protein
MSTEENKIPNDEDVLRIKVRKGYTLQIGGDFYNDGEIITTKYGNVKEQLWKIEIVGKSNKKPRVDAGAGVTVEKDKEEKDEEEKEEKKETEGDKNDKEEKYLKGSRPRVAKEK